MTTVADLIAYLQTLPADAEVKVTSTSGWNDPCTELIIPSESAPYSSDTCWFSTMDNVLKLGDY